MRVAELIWGTVLLLLKELSRILPYFRTFIVTWQLLQ